MNINNLSLEEKIAQKLMFGVYSDNIDIILKLIKDYKIGGVILYKKNYKNYDEMLHVIKKLKEANKGNKIPLFISIDQEGGRVNRLPSEFHCIENVYDMSKKDINLIYKNGYLTSKILKSLGVNMNFAPVLDINENNSKLLSKRCFYGNVDNVIKCSEKYVNAMNENGVISVIKHFPGHGITKGDSHFLPPYVYNYNEILDKHVKPFEYMINNKTDALMIGHLIIRSLTGWLPASISFKFINNYVRNKFKFDGLVITDEINMLSRSIIYNFGIVRNSMFSSGDIVLIKLKDNYDNFIERCVKYVNKHPKYLGQLDDSVNRIINIKKKYEINDNCDKLGCNLDDINKAIDELNNF